MTSFMTEETPAKVMTLLGATLFSLALMLGVSMTDASFSGTQTAVADPFSANNVMAMVDQVSASYSKLLTVNFIQPLTDQYKVYGENLAWISNESGLTSALGLDGSSSQTNSVALTSYQPQVAGAYSDNYAPTLSKGFSIDTLYSILIR